MFKKKKSNGSSFAFGLLLGGALGGVLALLFAPKSGEETRDEVANQYRRLTEESQDLVESVCDHSLEMIDKAKEIAHTAQEAASKFLDGERDGR